MSPARPSPERRWEREERLREHLRYVDFDDPPEPEHGGGPCARCGHDPACGFASEITNDGERWYCHTDSHSCYERWSIWATNSFEDEPRIESSQGWEWDDSGERLR